ncbi:Avr9/Cf-9 rapidly elicited protein 146 [Striga asiatica]|uniref:Avr9/Cf-9 rapidly elicited protein 146 n=1 Tax=Striga asiatica TaxID=4170 RepID=A0A5A7R2Y7_STRAF|nr:Avr9/Cf-9 rapidly elicited protein 146 [Striga asiatica]
MDSITFQDFVLKLSLHTSIIKHNAAYPRPRKSHRKTEHNFPAAAEKFWHVLRAAYFVLRKNISKPKLLADLTAAMKRGKIAGKSSIHNIMFPGGVGDEDGGLDGGDRQIPPGEFEFSCSNTPEQQAFRLPFRLNKRKRSPSPPRAAEEPDEEELFAAAMEIVRRTPAVRQLRVTDSPFPVVEVEENDGRVDEAAERFIMRFYRDLKRQNTMAC